MTTPKRDDRGQITTALVLVGTVLVVALGMLATRLGQATDEKSQVQIAADAAALAGAQQILNDDAPRMILEAIRGGSAGAYCGMGQTAASDFANRAGAKVVGYCYYSSSDTVQVSVEGLTNSVSGAPAKAKAESRMGLDLNCEVPSRPTPSPTPSPAPPPTPTSNAGPAPAPAPAPQDVKDEAHCGGVTIPIVFDGSTGVITIDLRDSEIRGLFHPALKS